MAFSLGNFDFGSLTGGGQSGGGSSANMFGDSAGGAAASAALGQLTSGKKGSYDSGGFGAAMTGLKMIPVYGQALALVEGIIGKETINKTIGAFFANGFKIKCWGASWTPARAEKELPYMSSVITKKAKGALNVLPHLVEGSINDYIKWFYGNTDKDGHNTERSWLLSTAKDCTKEGLKKYIAGLDKVHSENIRAMGAAIEEVGGQLLEKGKVKIILESHKNTSINAQLYSIFWPVAKTTATTVKNAVTGKTGEIGGNGFVVKNSAKAGGGGMVMLGLAALGFFLFKKK